MLGAIGSFSSMAVAGRELGDTLDTFEIMTYRSAVGVLIVLTVGGLAGTLGDIRTRRLPLHLARNLSHFAGQNLWFYAITVIPFAQVFAFEFSTPIWVALAAPLFLGEALTRQRLVAVMVGFLGILIVARPGLVPISGGVIAAAASALGFAGAAIATKRLTRTEGITGIMFWLTTTQLGFGLLTAHADGRMALPRDGDIGLLVLVGIAGLFAHFCMTRALQIAPAVIVLPMDFLRLPLITLVGAAFYNEPADAAVFVGAALIFAANYANILAERRIARAP